MDCLVDSNGARISYMVEGPLERPALLFINSIGTTRDLWQQQVPALVGTYRIIRYDARGHGSSSVPPGAYTIEQLGRDALAILDAEDARQAHVCGISLGGLTGLWLAIHAPDRVASLIVANSAARIGTIESWNERIAMVRERGMQGAADMAIPRWFSQEFTRRHEDLVERFRSMVAACPQAGYLGCCAALRDEDLREHSEPASEGTCTHYDDRGNQKHHDAAERDVTNVGPGEDVAALMHRDERPQGT